MKNLLYLIIIFLSGCGLTPEKVNQDDERLEPLFEAMAKVNRDSLGFTEVEKTSDIHLETENFIDVPYDVMLHIYGTTSRTIAFNNENSHYKWIGEQETHTGPREYETPDGTFKETITITYYTVPISGHQINQIDIEYLGPDSEAFGLNKLTLKEAKLLLEQWKK